MPPERESAEDTSAAARGVLIEGYRRMSPAERIACVCRLNAMLRELALADIRRRHPGISGREARLRLASRWLAADQMMRAFDWDPRVEGY